MPAVEAQTARLIERVGLLGYFNAEFKYDERDRTYKFIEVNARIWQQISIGQEIGLHFPMLQYLDLTGQALPDSVAVPDGIKWIDPFPDFESFVAAEGSRASLRRLPSLLRQWRGSIRGARNFALFCSDDLGPAWRQLGYGRQVLRLLWSLFRGSAL